MRGKMEEAARCLDGEPEYHDQGMGCGLEDRGITDCYDAMFHGWEKALERVYGENIAWAKDALSLETLPAEKKAIPTDWEDRVLSEMDRRFNLKGEDDDRMRWDDTQIGVEFAISQFKAMLP